MISKIFAVVLALTAPLSLPLQVGLGPVPPHSPVSHTEDPPVEPVDGATTWTVQPSSPDGPDGRISLRHTVAAGESVSDIVAITNFSAAAARFAVYASDGTITADGSFDLIPPGQPAVDSGTWVAIGPVDAATARDGGGIVVEVAAGSSVLVPVTIEVPANATPGDHPAGVVTELVREGGDAVQLATRVGVRMHLRVTGDLVGEVVPEVDSATYEPSWNPFAPGTVIVRYTVANSGNIRLGAVAGVTSGGPFGLARSSESVEQREILPGQSTVLETSMPVWPLVFSWGDVTVVPGIVGDDDEVELSSGTAPFTVWTMPWSQLVLLALIAGAVFLVRYARRRSRARVQLQIAAAVAAATTTPGDDVATGD